MNNVDYLIKNHLATLQFRRKRLEDMLKKWDYKKSADSRWITQELQMLDFFEFLCRDLFADGEIPSEQYGFEWYRKEEE